MVTLLHGSWGDGRKTRRRASEGGLRCVDGFIALVVRVLVMDIIFSL